MLDDGESSMGYNLELMLPYIYSWLSNADRWVVRGDDTMIKNNEIGEYSQSAYTFRVLE
jgi:hypothetical protein